MHNYVKKLVLGLLYCTVVPLYEKGVVAFTVNKSYIFLSDGMRDYVSLFGLQAFVGHGPEPHDGTVVIGSLEEERQRFDIHTAMVMY